MARLTSYLKSRLYQITKWQAVDAIYSVSKFGFKLWNWKEPRWDEYFFRSLEDLPEVTAAGSGAHWFEHYYGPEGPELDEVFLTAEGRVNWKFGVRGVDAVAAAFERLTGEPEPDFAATGFDDQMMVAVQARRSRRR
jgi:hypothetical protein